MNEPKPDLYVKDINGNYHRYEQEQEPVAWLVYAKGSRRYFTLTFDVEKVPEIYKGGEAVPLYTTPPQRKPMTDENCTWKQQDDIHMPDTWEADCGAMWTFTEGGPKDNDMHYCPKCGKPAIEAAHGIKE